MRQGQVLRSVEINGVSIKMLAYIGQAFSLQMKIESKIKRFFWIEIVINAMFSSLSWVTLAVMKQ